MSTDRKQFSESELSASEFGARAYRAVGELPTSEHRLRNTAIAKTLLEEVLPIASFVRQFETPFLSVRVRLEPPSAPVDAVMTLSGPEVDRGYLAAKYFVECTTTDDYSSHLRRKALVADGVAYVTGSVSRDRRSGQVVQKMEAWDWDRRVADKTTLVAERLDRKRKNSYPDPCILLIQVSTDGEWGVEDWASLVRSIRPAAESTEFVLVYLVDPWKNQVVLVD